MPEVTITSLVAILQRHGLTLDVLEDMVHFCERKCTGSITLHVVEGTIRTIEDRGQRKVSTTEPLVSVP